MPANSSNERDIEALVRPLAVPAAKLVETDAPSRSYLRGWPRLPDGFAWPERNGRPLDFIARVSLPDLRKALPVDWLPDSGALLFFYDDDEQPWGFDPKDRGGWAVLHVADLDSPVDPTSEPVKGPAGTPPGVNVAIEPIPSYPSSERKGVNSIKLDDDELDRFDELREAVFGGDPHHQAGGYPINIQSDSMEEECQFASNRIYCGDGSVQSHPRAKELKAGIKDWRLLLQVDSDEFTGFMWGDCGMIYFWIREEDARNSDFSNVWLILQCS